MYAYYPLLIICITLLFSQFSLAKITKMYNDQSSIHFSYNLLFIIACENINTMASIPIIHSFFS